MTRSTTCFLTSLSRHASVRIASALAGLTALLTVAACQAQGTAAPAPRAAEVALRARIQAEVGNAACTADAQCRTLPIGEKACGGPESWLAWSTRHSQIERLKPLSDELAALARQRNERSGMLSNCRFMADPGAQCREGQCTLRERSTAQ